MDEKASWAKIGDDFQCASSCEINCVSSAKSKSKVTNLTKFHIFFSIKFSFQFPVTIAPKSTVTLEAEISIEDPAKANAGHGWWYCSWNARTSPLILKLSVTDVEGRKMEIGQEFSNRRIQLDRSAPKDCAFWHFYDNVTSFERTSLKIKRESDDDPSAGYSASYPGRGLTLNRKTLRKYAFDAMKSGDDIIQIPLESEVFRMYAAIDRNARRVYAFRLEAIHDDFKV